MISAFLGCWRLPRQRQVSTKLCPALEPVPVFYEATFDRLLETHIFDSFVNKTAGRWGWISPILSLQQEQSGGIFIIRKQGFGENISLSAWGYLFPVAAISAAWILGHRNKSQGDKQVARKAGGRILTLT